jgi:hypothetical protein
MPKPAVKIDAALYQRLWEIQQGFTDIKTALDSFGAHPLFVRSEIKRFSALWEEARAATASYLLGVLEQFETEYAGNLAQRRLRRERREDISG